MACHSLGVQEEVVSPAVKSGLGTVVFPCNTFTAFVCTGRSLPLARAHKVGIMSTGSGTGVVSTAQIDPSKNEAMVPGFLLQKLWIRTMELLLHL